MEHPVYPQPTRELSEQRKQLAPETDAAFRAFSRQVFAPGALPAVTKQLIAVAVAHVTQCPYCIRGHTQGAMRAGASSQQIMEAIWVAAEMRAGGAFAHSAIALDTIGHAHDHSGPRTGAEGPAAADRVEEAGRESFPASDPPSWSSLHAGQRPTSPDDRRDE